MKIRVNDLYSEIRDNPGGVLHALGFHDDAKQVIRRPRKMQSIGIADGIKKVFLSRLDNIDKEEIKGMVSGDIIDIFLMEGDDGLTVDLSKLNLSQKESLRGDVYGKISKYLGTYEKSSSLHVITGAKSMTSYGMDNGRRSMNFTGSINDYYNENS